uniref:CSON000461 protein n=1 Tax=Culicoides sonorensis TaxID=179676 RepID=A0A336LQE4_CULSO
MYNLLQAKFNVIEEGNTCIIECEGIGCGVSIANMKHRQPIAHANIQQQNILILIIRADTFV